MAAWRYHILLPAARGFHQKAMKDFISLSRIFLLPCIMRLNDMRYIFDFREYEYKRVRVYAYFLFFNYGFHFGNIVARCKFVKCTYVSGKQG